MFASGGPEYFGIKMRTLFVAPPTTISGHDPESTRSVSIPAFLSEKVLCFKNQWISRHAVIKHVAIHGSGVHSAEPDSSEDEIIAWLRKSTFVGIVSEDEDFKGKRPGTRLISLSSNVAPGTDLKRPHQSVDLVLLELLAAAKYLLESESVQHLEQVIRLEMRQ